jgi:tetratricopeptide (TPR) repeat protein
MASGNVDDAIAAWEKAVAVEPRDDFSTYNLGLAYLRKGEKAKALRWFEAYLALKKDKLTADEKNRIEELMARCRDSRGRPAAAEAERRP